MALSNVALFGAAFLTPVFVGKITKSLGWQWSFYFVAIFLGAALPLMICFVPETAFKRPNYLNTDFKHKESRNNSSSGSDWPLRNISNEDTKEFIPGHAVSRSTVTTEVSALAPPQKHSFLQSMRLFNGRKTDESFFKLLLRPFPLFFHPGILWVSSCLLFYMNSLSRY